ncbi:MAG: amidohydrolase family protein [Candidatus Kapabacteria bacterium]|nr:amidohydrolase family protein [Candidatus Kapabacteria bacterium]
MTNNIYRGYIINPSAGGMEYIPDGALVVGPKGNILFCGRFSDATEFYPSNSEIARTKDIIVPGFIDMHTHIFQYPAIGRYGGPLLDWLNNIIYPLEAKAIEEDYSYNLASKFFQDALSFGTTTIVAFSTVHKQSACQAFKAARDSGIRAFIGNSMMDTNVPTNNCYSTEKNIGDSFELLVCWDNSEHGRLKYIVSPRFAGACTNDLMKRTANLARSKELFIQTHLAENLNELKLIAKMFPEFEHYTSVYDRAGLLTDKTLLAHCIYLSEKEIDLIRSRKSIIVHCPSSNRFLQSGVMPLRKYLDNDLKVGLGTDVAAGISLSMLNEMREAIESSKTWNILNQNHVLKPLSSEEVLRLATIKAAEYLNIDKETGNLEKGKSADFLIFDGKEIYNEVMQESGNNIDVLDKLVYGILGLKAKKVFIQGKDYLNKD